MKREKVKLGIQDLWPVALVVIIAGIGIAFGLDIIDDVSEDFVTNTGACGLNTTGGTGGTLLYTNCSLAYNATQASQEGIDNLAQKIPTIALVIVAAILIGILVRNLGGLAA